MLQEVISQLGETPPSPEAAARRLATEIAAEILAGTMSEIQGARRIWNISSQLPHTLVELHTFVYAASEWPGRDDMHPEFVRGIREAAADLVKT